MCHANLEVDFGPNINFIVGENGSGKSAILTALTVCFGTTAKQTNRASSLKEFIKHGCHYALVAVTLRNTGKEAYDPERYGAAITVERKITQSGAPFAVYNEFRQKVGQGKGELETILDHFSLDVSNPCTVMSQDASRSFLHSGRDEDKYRFFMQATLLATVKNNIMLASHNLVEMAEHVKALDESVPEKQQLLASLQDQLSEAQAVEKLKETKEHLRARLAWHSVGIARVEIETIEDLFKEDPLPDDIVDPERRKNWGSALRARARIEDKLAGAETDLAAADAERKQMLLQMDAYTATMAQVLAQKREVESALKQAHRNLKRADTDLIHAKNTMKNATQQKSDIQEQMQRLKEQFENQTQADTEANVQRAATAEADLQRATEATRAAVAAVTTAEQHKAALTVALKDLEAREREHDATQKELQGNLRQLEASAGSNVGAFGGAEVNTLLDLVAQQPRKFETPPLGPVGCYLSLQEVEWSTAVEVCLGGLLNAFVVGSYADKNALMRLAAQAKCRLGVVYVVKDFARTPRHAPEPGRLPPDHLKTMLHVLEARHDAVFNLVLDQAGVERVVLVNDLEEGRQVAFKQGGRNIKEAYLPDGTKIFKKGHSETVLRNKKRIRAPRLGVDVRAATEQIQQELEFVSKSRQEVAAARRQEQARLNEARSAVGAAHSARKEAQRFQGQMESLLEEVLNEQAQSQQASLGDCDVSALQAEVQALDAEIADSEARAAEDERQHAALDAEMKEREQEAEAQRAQMREREQENDKITSQLAALQERCRGLEHKKRKSEKQMHDYREKIQQKEADAVHWRAQLEGDLPKALEFCTEERLADIGGMPTEPHANEVLNKEIDRITRAISKEEARVMDGMSIQELEYQVQQQERKVAAALKKLDAVKLTLERLELGIDKRKKALLTIAKLVNQSVAHEFNDYMKQRGHNGRVKTNHKTETLEMEVVMAGQTKDAGKVSNTKTLSGGERSYSTLAFTLALGKENESPFRAMDEFDVFMDAVNRRVGTEHLLNFARKHPELQFIYLTPQDVSMLDKHRDDGFVHVQRMHNAAR